MQYIFMDNFRGFSETLLPLKQITFLVGENSTGKSSFLKLLYLLSRPQFWFSCGYALQEEAELGGYGDIVSAWASDKSYFRIGAISTYRDRKKGTVSCAFGVHTFGDRDGIPYLSRFMQFVDGRVTKLSFHQKRTQYKIITADRVFETDADVTHFFFDVVRSDFQDVDGFATFPKEIPPNPPIPVAIGIVRSMDKGKPLSNVPFSAEIPFSTDLTWIAPIRTKPQRFYDGMKKTFSPEGDHTPYMLRRSMRIRSRSTEFADRLRAFGEASGLFETLSPHSFGKSLQSPFEILIRFPGAELNINNVGYGVSQVLPLIVEFLSGEKHRSFAVQQPEVHLHPRAQAALGDLVFQLAKERNHRFVLETHSDYLIDRCRLRIRETNKPPAAQVIFFQRKSDGNRATILDIGPDGRYPIPQPSELRDFFVREEMSLLEV